MRAHSSISLRSVCVASFLFPICRLLAFFVPVDGLFVVSDLTAALLSYCYVYTPSCLPAGGFSPLYRCLRACLLAYPCLFSAFRS